MNRTNISDSEWIVMETLWDQAPRTASEVAKALHPRTGWALNTVRTLLSRLVEKGALQSAENASGVREFSPALDREAVIRAESQSFLDRVFKGAAHPLLIHFATQSNLTPDEVEQLKALLDKSLESNS